VTVTYLAQLTADQGLLAITSVLVGCLVWVVQKGTRANGHLIQQLMDVVEKFEGVEREEVAAHHSIIELQKKMGGGVRALMLSQAKLIETVADLVARLKIVEELLELVRKQKDLE